MIAGNGPAPAGLYTNAGTAVPSNDGMWTISPTAISRLRSASGSGSMILRAVPVATSMTYGVAGAASLCRRTPR